jgi:hypothetical protein
MERDEGHYRDEVMFVDVETGMRTESATVIAFPRGGEPLDPTIDNQDLVRAAEESISRAVEMSGDFSALYLKIHDAIDRGDMGALERLRDQLLTLRARYGFKQASLRH